MRASVLILTPHDAGSFAGVQKATRNANTLSDRLHQELVGGGKLDDLCTVLVPVPERSVYHKPAAERLTPEHLATMVRATQLVYVDFFAARAVPFLCQKTIDAVLLAASLGRRIMVLEGSEGCLQTINLLATLEQAGFAGQAGIFSNGLPAAAIG